MAWVSPKVYAILSKSEEGKDIIERLPDMSDEERDEAVDEFFSNTGKGASFGNDYKKAKEDDEFEESVYRNADTDYSKDLDEDKDKKAYEEQYGDWDDLDYERAWGPSRDDDEYDNPDDWSDGDLEEEISFNRILERNKDTEKSIKDVVNYYGVSEEQARRVINKMNDSGDKIKKAMFGKIEKQSPEFKEIDLTDEQINSKSFEETLKHFLREDDDVDTAISHSIDMEFNIGEGFNITKETENKILKKLLKKGRF